MEITPDLPSDTYDDVRVQMSQQVTYDEIVEHLKVKASMGGNQMDLYVHENDGQYGLYENESSATSIVSYLEIRGEIIIIKDATTRHGPKIYSVEWL